MIALSLPITVILSLVSLPLIQVAFGFPLEDARMILWTTQAYLIGLLGHSVVGGGSAGVLCQAECKDPDADLRIGAGGLYRIGDRPYGALAIRRHCPRQLDFV